MADTYPWGSQAPSKRVEALKRQITANDQKRTEQVEAHRKRIAEIDEADRQLKKDLNAAQAVVDREHREAMSSAAARMMEKVLASAGTDISESLKSGELEKLLAEALGKVGSSQPRKRAEKDKAQPALNAPAAAEGGDGDAGGAR